MLVSTCSVAVLLCGSLTAMTSLGIISLLGSIVHEAHVATGLEGDVATVPWNDSVVFYCALSMFVIVPQFILVLGLAVLTRDYGTSSLLCWGCLYVRPSLATT